MADFLQDFNAANIHSGNGGSGGRGGDVGAHNVIGNSNTVNNVNISFTGPQIIVNSKGVSLDVGSDESKDYTRKYVSLGRGDKKEPSLMTSEDPFPWKVSQSEEGFKLGTPDSDLAISIGSTATVAPPADPNTQLYILEDTEANHDAIKNGTFIKKRGAQQDEQEPADQLEGSGATNSPANDQGQGTPATNLSPVAKGSQINVTVNDLSGSGQAVEMLRDIRNFFTSDGVKNLVICLGHHRLCLDDAKTPSPAKSPAIPETSNDEAAPSYSPPSYTASECTGFPMGYFRIRAAGSNHFNHYWSPLSFETHEDGNGFSLATLDPRGDKESQVFFINSRGNLCCGSNGAEIDVFGNTVILCHSRPRTQPWPNPWSHPLPTFTYSPKTKLITVQFHVDPVVTDQWPRHEREWKGKEFVLAGRSAAYTKVPTFDSVARWAPPAMKIGERWTSRAGRSVPHYYSLAVEDKPLNFSAQDLNRMRWEIEQVE
ncbi:hypothetical protein CVT26_004821 [Gymnopilus dilepis]|uniref:Uncharacterized protein n=1 Tax=Gymnopilus dilepis TaxID=231916 RepID=A0A409XZK9_9AGAR|nr:hypothetical protein CVT26_004821 [Gymnopilus dilepis]